MIISIKAFSQDLPNSIRHKIIELSSDTIKIDSLSIVPGSLTIYYHSELLIPDKDFKIDYLNSKILFWNDRLDSNNKTITVEYRVLPINLNETFQNKDTSLIINNYYIKKQNQQSKTILDQEFIEDDKLDKNGSISRGLAFGNQRDVSSLSNLNLQLSGKLNDEVSILAAISDNNMPIQPEGNTQQIQEFDKIYIQMFNKKSGIKLGDIELNNPAGYFMSLKKQTRGIQMYSEFNPGKSKRMILKSDLSAGMAKGKYTRLKIQGMEANQGPYKLLGSNNESYIIVLSGSEKVYIDGKLLVRGDKFDYVIDYNSSEITFTSNRPITKDSRIIVEFEYTQQYYPRLQTLQTNYLETKNATFWFNFYAEKDNKNDPLSNNYDTNAKSVITSVGDSIQYAYASGVKKVDFDSEKILYQLLDTTVNAKFYDSIYQYSTNPQNAQYQLNFLYVGKNMGNYSPVINNTNGKVYKWVSPLNNIKQGDYEPIIIFMTPKKNVLANLGGQFKIGEFGKSSFELAFSNEDLNTYSSKNNGDDKGYALKLNIEQSLIHTDTTAVNLKFYANYQMSDKKFKPIENYYDVEFERDWNISLQSDSWQEQRLIGGLIFNKKGLGIANFASEYMLRANKYEGKKVLFSTNMNFNGFQLISGASYLRTNNLSDKSDFLRHNLMLIKHFSYLNIGLSEETENNLLKNNLNDSILISSFKYSEFSAFVNSPDSSINQYFVNYKYRKDYLPINNLLNEYSLANTFQTGLNLLKNKSIKWKTLITFRNLEFTDSSLSKQNSENYLSGRQEITLQLFKGAINFSFFYETASGLELKKEFLYVEVQKGQGQYTWIDYNDNNIKELDEFELAKFADQANYIRLFIPGNNYVRAFTTQLNQSINLQPDRIWSKNRGIKGFVSVFSDQFAYSILQKSDLVDFIPYLKDNSGLISSLLMFRNNFSFKSKNRIWQTDYLFENNMNKSLLINGFDIKGKKVHSIKIRLKMFHFITFYNTALLGDQSYNSEFFSSKNYIIQSKSNETSLQFKPADQLLTSLKYVYTLKLNILGEESAILNEIKLNLNQVLSAKINVQSDLSYVHTTYNAESTTSVGYEMLDGLKPGMNLIWNISYNHKLSKLFQLSVLYNGRWSEQSNVIHNGSVQLKANF